MKDAYRLGESGAFHLWRKSAKYFRYHVEALEPAWPEVLGPLAAAADRLAETLGDEHDFTCSGLRWRPTRSWCPMRRSGGCC